MNEEPQSKEPSGFVVPVKAISETRLVHQAIQVSRRDERNRENHSLGLHVDRIPTCPDCPPYRETRA